MLLRPWLRSFHEALGATGTASARPATGLGHSDPGARGWEATSVLWGVIGGENRIFYRDITYHNITIYDTIYIYIWSYIYIWLYIYIFMVIDIYIYIECYICTNNMFTCHLDIDENKDMVVIMNTYKYFRILMIMLGY